MLQTEASTSGMNTDEKQFVQAAKLHSTQAATLSHAAAGLGGHIKHMHPKITKHTYSGSQRLKWWLYKLGGLLFRRQGNPYSYQ